MNRNNTPPRWIQGLSGIALLLIALAAAGLSLAVNLIAGMMVGLPIAIMFALSDTAKIMVPVVCQAIGFNRHLKATYIAASIVSVLCALLAMADYFGSRLAEIENKAQIVTMSEQRVNDLRSSLTTVRKMAAEEAQRGGCGPNCRALNDRAASLETSLSKAVTARESKSAETTTGKGLLAEKLAGIAPGTMDTLSALVLMLAGLMIMELCAHTAGPAASMIGKAMKKPATTKRKKRAKASKPKPRKAPAERDWTKVDAYGPVKRTKSGKTDFRTKAGRRLKQAAYGA